MYDGYQSIPLPPPWRRVRIIPNKSGESLIHFVNDVTNEISDNHPFSRYISDQLELKDKSESNEGSDQSVLSKNIKPQVGLQKYSEFRCTWKERDLLDDKGVFELTIRYQHQDQLLFVRFDGTDNNWSPALLECCYGPITRYDLFVGSKIKLSGRNFVITSASCEACHWIEESYKELSRDQEVMCSRILKFGILPVVRRADASKGSAAMKDSSGGRRDLRRICRENARLKEQLLSAGISIS
jgi:hypothetical protein